MAVPALLLCAVGAALLPQTARAEYRAYELDVVDLYDCRINKRDECRSARLLTAMNPDLYLSSHGGGYHIGVVMMATWMCYGDTSYYRAVCPRPAPVKPKFQSGGTVRINLEKHITNGWEGRVELVYYQASVRSNVYGIRFPDRRSVYARYFEKDLRPPGGAAATGASAAAAAPAAPAPAAQAPAAPAPAAQAPAAQAPAAQAPAAQ